MRPVAGKSAVPDRSADQPTPTWSWYAIRKNVTPIAAYNSAVATFVTVKFRLRNRLGGTSGSSVWVILRTKPVVPVAAIALATTTDVLFQPCEPASVNTHVAAPRLTTARPAPNRSR